MTFADAPLEGPVHVGQLMVRIHHADEVSTAVDAAMRHPDIRAAHLFADDLEALWDTFRSAYAFVVAAGGAVTADDGRLLVMRRLGKWDLPKGKVDKGEGIEAAALREVQEECGIEQLDVLGALPSTWHTYERNGRQHLKRTDWFLMVGCADEVLVPQTEEGIEEVRWMTPVEVSAMKADTYPSLLPVIEAWEQR